MGWRLRDEGGATVPVSRSARCTIAAVEADLRAAAARLSRGPRERCGQCDLLARYPLEQRPRCNTRHAPSCLTTVRGSKSFAAAGSTPHAIDAASAPRKRRATVAESPRPALLRVAQLGCLS